MTEVDCLVVGEGVTGSALALHLSREPGTRVMLLGRGQLNSGASGGNAGSLHAQMLSHYARAATPAGIADAERPLDLHRRGIEEWQRLQDELACDFQLHQDGGLMVAETAEEESMLAAKVEREGRHGIPVEILTSSQARDRAPYLGASVKAAAWCPIEGRLNPLLATPALANAARANGAELRLDSPLTSLRRDGDRFIAETPQGAIAARQVVNAAGPWAAGVAAMLGLRFDFGSRPMQMCVTEPAPPIVGHLVQHIARRLTLKQAHSGNILIGGGWPAEIGGDGRTRLLRTSIEGGLAIACRIAPMIGRLHLLRSWTAANARVADGNPVLGEVATVPGFFMAVPVPNGYTLGPICARLVASVMMRRLPGLDLSAWSPDRFLRAAPAAAQ